MDERLAMQSFFGSVTYGFVKRFTLGSTLSCVNMSLKGVGLVLRRRKTLRFPAIASAVVIGGLWGGLVGGVVLGTLHVDGTNKAMIAGGFVGTMSEIRVYFHDKVFSTKASAMFTGQGMHMMRRRPLFLTKSFIGANMGGALYLLLRDEDPQGRVADHTSLMSLENN